MQHSVLKKFLLSPDSKSSAFRMFSKLIKVHTEQGVIIGQEKSLPSGKFFQSFQGIPYGVPPLGELRFKSPLKLENFGVSELHCLKEGNVSIQRDPLSVKAVGSEDCLFLNVYAPTTTPTCSNPLPVMVWIHGGGFCFGSGNSDYYLPLSLLQENVIVVTMNYRLGALGFLCLPEEGVWGNAGLKDQRLALQWVQDNIQAFNGDPKNVTIFGESAGAVSVHLHVLSKHAKTLFQKAIMQSGVANMEWVFQWNPAYKTRRLAEVIGLKTNETKKLLKFLQSPQVKPLDILTKTLQVMTADERRRCMPFPFSPVVEDKNSPDCFIDLALWDRLNQPDSVDIPSIMGYNSAEGLAMIVHTLKNLDDIDKDLERFVPRNIPLEPEDDEIKEIANKIRNFYFNGERIKPKFFNSLTNMLSDYHFVIDMQNLAQWHVKLQPNSRLYFYRFNYVGDRNIYKQMLQMNELAGACHGDELFYLFQMSGDDGLAVSERDQRMILWLSRLWANFAKYSNPTEYGHGICNWAPVSPPVDGIFNLDYLAIENDGMQMKSNPDKERMHFWKSIYSLYPPVDLSRLSSKL